MKPQINWEAFVAPLDYRTTHTKTNSLLKWNSWENINSGILFHCETALGELVDFRLEVISPQILRARMNCIEVRETKSDMLVRQDWGEVPFEIQEKDDELTLLTEALRVELPKFPWGLRVFDRKAAVDTPPFFAQQNEDRAYGPGFEVPPVGYENDLQGRVNVRETVSVSPGEAFYGFGERFTALDKWGQELEFWAVDSGNVSSNRAYKNIPFLLSTAGYGLFVHTSFPMVYRMGSESNSAYSFHVLDSHLDYFLIHGPSFKDILKRYSNLTGKAPVPPKWSFGFWISRCMYMSRDEVEDVVEGMRQHGFPCDALSIDPYWQGEAPWCSYEFDETAYPQPEEMIKNLADQGIKTCLWITPYIPKDIPLYEEAQEKGFFIKNSDGEPAAVLEAFAGDVLAAIDFTNPAARAWFQSKLRTLLEMGVATFKSDFAEQAPIEAIYHDGRSGLEMHNIYPLLYNGTVFDLTKDYFGRGLVWGRSAYAGSQRCPVQWGGDSYAHMDQMVGQLRGLLGYGLSGVPFCSHDVGGFDYQPRAFDVGDLDNFPRDAELYIRWLQFGVFSSHLRAHGKQPREPWEYGDEATEIAMRYLKLRYRLLPYIYSEAVRSTQHCLPMVRPLVLEYQHDPNTENIDLQYLFGPDFLVAPVFTRAKSRRVYLPQGEWFDYWTKDRINGGRWIEVDAPLEKLPLWLRVGAIIPMGPEMDFVNQKPLDPLTLEIYGPSKNAATTIFDEDQPEIQVRYALSGNRLNVEIENPPPNVEIFCFGEAVTEITLNGQAQKSSAYPGGQFARFEI